MSKSIVPDWQTLRSFGSSGIAKASYLFPVVGYALIFNNYAIDFLASAFSIEKGAISQLLFQLYFLYFGLLFFSAASIVYAAFCPAAIKAYPDPAAFILRTAVTFSSGDLLLYAKAVSSDKEASSLRRRAHSVAAVVHAEGVGAVEPDLVLEIRKRFFEIESVKNIEARIACAVLYGLGTVGILAPTVFGVINVIRGAPFLRSS